MNHLLSIVYQDISTSELETKLKLLKNNITELQEKAALIENILQGRYLKDFPKSYSLDNGPRG